MAMAKPKSFNYAYAHVDHLREAESEAVRMEAQPLNTPPTGTFARFLWRIRPIWHIIVGVLLPLILLPLVFLDKEDDTFEVIEGDQIILKKSTKFRAAYAIIIVAVYWMLEVMPLAITSILPIVLFPFLGILDTGEVSPKYLSETNALLLGELVLNVAVEYSNLHKRIALKAMILVGSTPVRLLFGVMCTSAFLSMWMSNTASTAMMLPTLIAVLDQLAPVSSNNDTKRWRDLRKMFMFGVAYSSNIGGTTTITGTGPNLVFQSLIKDFESSSGLDTKMNFATWMALHFPATVLNILVTFLYLVFTFHGFPPIKEWPCFKKEKSSEEAESEEEDKRRVKEAEKMLKVEYEKLGKMSFHEISVLLIFTLVALGWIFREPKFMDGWNDFMEADIGDGTVAILGVVALFLIPKDLTFFTGVPRKGQPYQALLDWKFAQSNLSWGVILLLGGGFALSEGAERSGLSYWIGEQLRTLDHLPRPLFLLLVMIVTAAVTELCSNVATANIILPILLTVSRTLKIHPLYLTLPATISCSFAFMLPVATPPNAIVFTEGSLKTMDMVKTGAFLNISCIAVYFLVQISLGESLFNYSDWDYKK